MRVAFSIALLLSNSLVGMASDIKPTDASTPLFRIYEPKFTSLGSEAQIPKANYKEPPLLVIRAVRDLILAADQKGVMIGLTAADTQKFAQLTHQFDKRYLILIATDSIGEVMHITAPIEDGYIGFKYPEAAPIAEYLRRRFRIAEFK